MKPDLYAMLGVSNDASPQDLAAAIDQKLAAARDNNEKVYLRHAKEVLGSPASRAAYDAKLRREKLGPAVRVDMAQDAEPSGIGALSRSKVLLLAAALVLAGGAWYQQHRQKAGSSDRVAQRTVIPGPVLTSAATVPPPSNVQPAPQPQAQAPAELSPEAVYASVAPSVVVVESIDANGRVFARGSGVITAAQQVVTNCHVIQQAVQIKVRSANAEFAASSNTSDTQLDLCMLQVNNLPGMPVPRGSINNMRVGQTVYAIGAPHGLDRTLSQGLVSALREMPMGVVIQTSAAISPGSSGGGLFDSSGRLVGITTFQAKAGQNLNFAVPADWLDTMRTR